MPLIRDSGASSTARSRTGFIENGQFAFVSAALVMWLLVDNKEVALGAPSGALRAYVA